MRLDPLLTHSATRLARMIRAGEVTSRQVVDAHIRRIEAVNPAINAVVRARYEEARAEADAADARRGGADLPPLHGVPCTIKEAFALRGMPNSSGLWARRDVVSTDDAPTVARLRAAGAIPLGVTNVSELCMWMESINTVYGRTRNPYDTARTAGGSSGGEGAIVGAAASPFGLGSDIGGSIRMPAFFNGVFGHKPTGGLVPGTGQYPCAENDALRLLTTGPICRRAEDLWPLLTILAGPDGRDSRCVAWKLGDPADVRVPGLDVVVVEDNGRVPVSGEMRAAVRRAGAVLARAGARVRAVRIDALRHSFEIWSARMDAAAETSFKELMGNGAPLRAGRELGRWIARRSRHTFPGIMLALVEDVPKLLPTGSKRYLEVGLRLREEILGLVGGGVLLYPSYPTVAPRHVWPLVPPFNWMYTAIFNALEMPVTQVPLGLNPRGVPLGVQVAAAHGADHVTIAVALELERAFGGWVPPNVRRGAA
jgi:fatty acid amide hydrolase 2